jgi:hypothetical protein
LGKSTQGCLRPCHPTQCGAFFWSQAFLENIESDTFTGKAGTVLIAHIISKEIKEIHGLFTSTQTTPDCSNYLKMYFTPVICHFLLLSKMIGFLMVLLICDRTGTLIMEDVKIVSKLRVNKPQRRR